MQSFDAHFTGTPVSQHLLRSLRQKQQLYKQPIITDWVHAANQIQAILRVRASTCNILALHQHHYTSTTIAEPIQLRLQLSALLTCSLTGLTLSRETTESSLSMSSMDTPSMHSAQMTCANSVYWKEKRREEKRREDKRRASVRAHSKSN